MSSLDLAGSLLPLILFFDTVLADICRQHDPGAKLFSYLDALMAAATRSVNLELQPSKITLVCLGGHLQIQGDIEPGPVVLGEQATMIENHTTVSTHRHHDCRTHCGRTQRANC